MNKFSDWLKTKRAAAYFALAGLAGGFLFLGKSLTGMAIFEDSSAINPLSLIGLCLIICSIILIAYSLKKD